MKKSARRWLFQRRKPELAIAPLILRTSWGDFAFRMRRAIAIDVSVLLGEVRRADLARQQETRLLPTIDHNAPTLIAPPHWFYSDETLADPDPNRTQPIPALR